VTARDVRRLATRFGVDEATARRRYTKNGPDPGERVLRHRHDALFQSACRFLDPDSRRCTIYEHRPQACRDYPGTGRCGYYDFLSAERRRQEDPDLVLAAWVSEL
jgi:Fe-S-cluster containining protein